jgi:hypothetical protein
LKITGKAEDEDVCCTFTGTNTLTVNGIGTCSAVGDWGGVEKLHVFEEWGTGQAEMHCSCKGNVDCHPYSGPIQLAGLGNQKVDLTLWLHSNGDCYNLPISGGLISGKLSYCLFESPSGGAGELDVGLLPLVEEPSCK